MAKPTKRVAFSGPAAGRLGGLATASKQTPEFLSERASMGGIALRTLPDLRKAPEGQEA